MAKTLSVILVLLILTLVMVAMYCTLVIASRFDEQADEQIKEDIDKTL